MLDLGLCLESDSGRFWQLFDRDYHRFKAPRTDRECTLSISHRSSPSPPTLSIDDELISLEGHLDPDSYVYQRVLRALFEKMEDFIILHAGAAGKEGRALIITGPPRSGKSTLTLELIKRGFGFYTDDICPVHRRTGLVHPFPRSPWIKHDGGGGSPIRVPELRDGKLPFEVEALGAPVETAPGRPIGLICLDHGARGPSACTVRLALKKERDEPILADLRKIATLNLERIFEDVSEWRIEYPLGQGLTARIQQLLEKHKDRIWNAFREDRIEPDFSSEPIVAPLSTDAAAFRLLRELKQGLPGQSVGAPARSPGQLFMALNRLLGPIPCHRLRVGTLDTMADLAIAVFEKAGSP